MAGARGWCSPGCWSRLTLKYLPGTGGHSPALGFQMGGGPPVDRHLPGVVLASLATLSLGAVLGPEAPLIAIGGGLAALTVRLVKKDAPPMAVTIMASAGSFAAISTLLGSPLLGAFLIMEAAGIAGRRSPWSRCPACSPPASGRWSSSGSTRGPASAPSRWP